MNCTLKNDMVLNTLHLFAGAGGGILADQLLGHRTIGAVEIEAYPRKVLLARQLDGCLPQFPIWDDVTTFRADNPDCASYINRLRGIANNLCISGGFPCQDISSAGKGAGLDGERSGLWSEFARIIGEIRPRHAFIENSPMLTSRGGPRVIADLARIGYDCRWGVVSAADAGAPHLRKRLWIYAANTSKLQRNGCNDYAKFCMERKTQFEFRNNYWKNDIPHALIQRFDAGRRNNEGYDRSIFGAGGKHIKSIPNPLCDRPQGYGKDRESARQVGLRGGAWCDQEQHLRDTDCIKQKTFDTICPGWVKKSSGIGSADWWATERGLDRVAHGVAHRVDRLKAIGNGQVPAAAVMAWNILKG